MEKAVLAISKAQRCVIFTGAGMSKDSGIDTFRGGSGFWNGIFGNIALAYGGTPYGWSLTPGLVWSYFISNFYGPIAEAGPHNGFFALATLQKEKFKELDSFHVVTMNVDGYHQASGINASCVSEIHGTIRRYRCISCSNPIEIPNPLTSNPPKCSICQGYPRPDVTLFTEALPEAPWQKSCDIIRKMRKGDVMLVIGTSSVVYPAAYIPQFARDSGATIIEVNPETETPLKSMVDISIQGTALQILPELAKKIVDSDKDR